ncbi:MAG: FAD-dependent oxidoreductase, partial [Candidatus Tectomicrobia bacterium]
MKTAPTPVDMIMASTRIVIIGGGFAGVKCAKTLHKKLAHDTYDIVLFNRENHMVFHPLLAEVAGASINPDAVAAPLRQMLPTVHCRTEEVQRLDLENGYVEYEGYDGLSHRMAYDHVVLACGSAVNLGAVPGMADHAFPLKTIGDAIALRLHIMQQLEKAEVCDDAELKHWYLSFIVVGGGFSGVEIAGEINDLLRGTHRFFHNITDQDLTVSLIHSRDQLLPELTPSLGEFARVKMEKAGIHVVLSARVAYVTPEGVGLTDDRVLRGATVVCTVGNSMPSIIERLEVLKERNRLLTDADMRLCGYQNAWSIGDCAYVVNAYNNMPSPPTGQFAERQGQQAAINIMRALRGQPTRPFAFKPLGQLCAIGGHSAVAEMLGMRISGFVAWFLWRSVYLFKLPSWARRAKVGFDWGWDLVFPRDLAHPKTDQTERVATAHYQPGNYIFRQGDRAMNFFVIVSGEVEVLQASDASESATLLNVLGPGDFFGEIALIDDTPHNASIRARTAVEVLILGKNVFAHLSNALAPFRDLLSDAMVKRRANLWQRLPAAREALDAEPLSTFIELFSKPHLTPDTTFADAINRFDHDAADFCCIVDPNGCLQGVLTRTDIFRAIENGARYHTPVADFMVTNLITVTTEDPSLVATAIMHEHGFKWLPVV